MSTAPVQTKSVKTKKDKERDKERKTSLPQPNDRLKTVVRRLPPNLPEEIFWQSVQEWVTEDTSVWKIYRQGKLRKKLNKENIPSRAYIAFKDEEHLAAFSHAYDGHIFRDKTGVESQAVVEFAPYPKIPSEKRKPDPRNGTIERDEDYISFLESLKASENLEPVSLETLIASAQPAPPPKTTPLLEALKAEKSANKDKEAILRNHAHYNNMSIAALRKEEKKKATAGPASTKADPNAAATANTSKKAKKAQASASASSSQAMKNVLQTAQGPNAKNTPSASTSASQPAKPPKPTRPPRGQNKVAASAKEAPRTVTTPIILMPPAANVNATTISTTPALTSSAEPAPAAASTGGRRSRPVIGLASRQFEAALSGVSGLANAATERKRRERERDGQASGAGSVPPTPTASGMSGNFARIDNSDTERPAAPAKGKAPTKRGGRRGTGGGGGGGGGAQGSAAPGAANAPQVKVPSILQRAPEPLAQKPTPAPAVANGVVKATPTAPPAAVTEGGASGSGAGGAGRGGGRRGRGGGRGRGTAPSNAPRGG